MKKKYTIVFLLFISSYTFSQEDKLPSGWDIVSLDNKPAYMNLITGTISKKYPKKPAVIKPLEKDEFDPTIIHVVKKGETLSKISRKYNLGLSQLYKLNNVTNFDNLKIGQKVVIGYGQSDDEKESFLNTVKKDENKNTSEVIKERSKNDFSNIKKINDNYHLVKEKETLYRISIYYKIPVDKLRLLNNLKNNTIFKGQKLKLK